MSEEIDFENVQVTFPDNDVQKYPKPLLLSDLLTHKSLSDPKIICLMVNGEVKSLNTKISFGKAKVSPILVDSSEGSSAYRRTLVKIFATAAHQAYAKQFNVIVHHRVNNGYLAKKADMKDFTEEEIQTIKTKMEEFTYNRSGTFT